ncbi:M28 family peptidase [Paenibacillus tarimensis]|uniref:M28 family peptidase n=1 Tax=Paenibacillus tarimensis TaxID=416012 RepID=UPI001F25EA79|nr:M28 family peptidase [Paenibacillus tarimensis]MCF2942676.1 M28 family peptidase [Paenibacillus tarimensis]
MLRKFFHPILIVVSFVVILSGCNETEREVNKSFDHTYEGIIQELSDTSYKGRLTGTKGNEQAQKYIEKHFERIGLEPYQGESFAIPYTHQFFDPDKQAYLIVIKTGTEERELIYGKDYLEQRVTESFDQTGTPVFVENNFSSVRGHVAIWNNGDSWNGLLNLNPMAIFIKKNDFTKHLPTGYHDIPVFQLSEEVYEWLNKNKNTVTEITIKIQMKEEQVQAHNIVGMLKGTPNQDHKDLIILSAHFDSLGWSGKEIYSGAVDNATGVSALIQLAANLKNHYSGHAMQPDVVFAAFNGEESGLQGSRAFVKQMDQHYDHIYAINMDCIGLQEGGDLLVIGDGAGESLMNQLQEYLTEHGVQAEVMPRGYSSDHLAFTESGIPAVTLGQSKVDMIHTTRDAPELVDHDYLHDIVTSVFNFVANSNHIELPVSSMETVVQVDEGFQEEIEAELNKMTLGDYQKYGNDKNSALLFKSEGEFDKIEEAEKMIKGLDIPETIQGYTFHRVTLSSNWSPNEADYSMIPYNKIHRIDSIDAADTSSLTFIYKDKSNVGFNLTLQREPIVYEHSDEVEGASEVETEEFHEDGKEYYLYKIDDLLMVGKELQVEGNTYYLQIYKGKVVTNQDNTSYVTIDWTKAQQDEALDFVQSLSLDTVIGGMGLK